jgi:DNA-binding transcriptional ArsR family regulator
MNQLFKALNDPTRRQILELLKQGSLTAGEIADACEVGKPTVSHHLDLLRQAELIEEERQGQFRRYHLNTSVVEDVMVWLRTLVETPRAAAKKAAAIKRLSPRTSNS